MKPPVYLPIGKSIPMCDFCHIEMTALDGVAHNDIQNGLIISRYFIFKCTKCTAEKYAYWNTHEIDILNRYGDMIKAYTGEIVNMTKTLKKRYGVGTLEIEKMLADNRGLKERADALFREIQSREEEKRFAEEEEEKPTTHRQRRLIWEDSGSD